MRVLSGQGSSLYGRKVREMNKVDMKVCVGIFFALFTMAIGNINVSGVISTNTI